MKIEQVMKVGDHNSGTVTTSFDKIVEVLGFEPNVTHLDDNEKVKASWGFTVNGIRCGIWCYKFYGDPKNCTDWSFFGPEYLKEILEAEFNRST